MIALAQRDTKGRFGIGNVGGPGRPRRSAERDYAEAVFSACSVELWTKICLRAVDDAANGDAKARDWLAKYILGVERLAYDLEEKNTRGVSARDIALENMKNPQFLDFLRHKADLEDQAMSANPQPIGHDEIELADKPMPSQ